MSVTSRKELHKDLLSLRKEIGLCWSAVPGYDMQQRDALL